MDLNETKRKRSVPDWMRSSPKSSSVRSVDSTGNVSPIKKSTRPSYPPICIKKTKQLPKLSQNRMLESGTKCRPGVDGSSSYREQREALDPDKELTLADNNSDLSHDSDESNLAFEFSGDGDDNFSMTVDDLTRVAQEIINEKLKKQC